LTGTEPELCGDPLNPDGAEPEDEGEEEGAETDDLGEAAEEGEQVPTGTMV
jgi:hypothetical protein